MNDEAQPERRHSLRTTSHNSVNSTGDVSSSPNSAPINASDRTQKAYQRTRGVPVPTRRIRDTSINECRFKSVLDAAKHDCQNLASNNEHSVLQDIAREGTLNDIADIFADADAFNCCNFPNDPEIGRGICRLAAGIFKKEFEKLRCIDQLKYSLLHWEPAYLEAFNFDKIFIAMKDAAPCLIELFEEILNITDASAQRSTDAHRYIVMIVAQLAHFRNSHTNFIQGFLSLYAASCNVSKRFMPPLNHIGVLGSHSSMLAHLKSAATGASRYLLQTATKGKAFTVVFDNLTFLSRVRDQRLFNSSEFLAMIAGYLLIPPPSKRVDMFTLKEDIDLRKLANLTTQTFGPRKEDFSSVEKSFLALFADLLLKFAERFPDTHSHINPKLADLPDILQIDLSEAFEILPLRIYDFDEGKMNEMIEFLYSLQQDIGLSELQCTENAILHCGDLLTIKNIGYVLVPFEGLILEVLNFVKANARKARNCNTLLPLWGCYICTCLRLPLFSKTIL
jgi:Family of unknown function (DUF6589)